MNTYRKNAVAAGILFLMGFIGVPAAVLLTPVLQGPDFLVQFAVEENRVLWGIFLYLIMASACSGIAVWMYPVLKKKNEALAFWSAGFRFMEALIFVLASVCLISLSVLGKEYLKAGTPESPIYPVLGEMLLSCYDFMNRVTGLAAWILGALIYHWIFFRTKLIPRWLSLWGLIGVPPALAACLLLLFGIEISENMHSLLNMPLGLQEIGLALWLIIKGFDQSVLQAFEKTG